MTHRSELGAWGEECACAYLVDKGFRVLARNVRKQWGELDIVAMARDKTLVFVEVKTVQQHATRDMRQGISDGEITAENQMTAAKIGKFKKAAMLYAGMHQELINDKKGWRLDVIAITKFDDDAYDIKHYENI